jgi:hypothetical protein
LAQPHTAGSCEAENRSVGTKNFSSAQHAHFAAGTEGSDQQAGARAEIVESIAPAQTVALGETIIRAAFSSAIAAGEAVAGSCHLPAFANGEAQARLIPCFRNHWPHGAVQADIAL